MFQFRAKSTFTISGILLTSLLSMSGCLNVFSPFDKPSGDTQLLSAARACFDKGDFDCAQKYYDQVSSANADVKTEQEAVLVFARNGASMKEFMTLVGNVTDLDVGKAITIFANDMTPTAGLASRQAMWNAWQTYNNISNTDVKFFVEFVGALSIAEEILAESAGGNSQVIQNDIVTNSSICNTTNCAGSNSCGPPSNGQLTQGPAEDITTTLPTNAIPTSRQLFDMINAAETALQSLSQGGRFSNIFSTFQNIIDQVPGGSATLDSNAAVDQCFRAELLSQNIGLSQ